jgi:thiol:disulfide interchange protein DsbD
MPPLFVRRFSLLASLLLVAVPAWAQDLLDPEVAFRTTAKLIKPNLIEVRYLTAPGYYLYRDRLSYVLEPGAARLGKPKLPAGKTKNDEFFGKQVIYRRSTVVTLPLSADVHAPLILTADLQGCADLGVCYPPVRRKFTLSPVASPAK